MIRRVTCAEKLKRLYERKAWNQMRKHSYWHFFPDNSTRKVTLFFYPEGRTRKSVTLFQHTEKREESERESPAARKLDQSHSRLALFACLFYQRKRVRLTRPVWEDERMERRSQVEPYAGCVWWAKKEGERKRRMEIESDSEKKERERAILMAPSGSVQQ